MAPRSQYVGWSLSSRCAALRGDLRRRTRALDDDSCLGLFDALETIDRLFHSARFSLLAELDDRDLTDRRAGHNVANHAGWRHRSDPRRVRRDLRTASRLRRLPRLSDALRTGELSRMRLPRM